MTSEIASWPDDQPFGPRLTYPFSFDFYQIGPEARHAIAERKITYEQELERLINPDTQLESEDVLKLVEAYYHTTRQSYISAEASVAFPPIPQDKWLAPIRVTYKGIVDDAVPWHKIIDIPVVSDIEEAIKTARTEGHWESFRAASSQLSVKAVDILLSGPHIGEGEHPEWCNVWLIPPENVTEHEAGIAGLKQVLGERGYTFPDA